MTAITNYNSLKSNIADWHKRTDDDVLAKYDTFIDACEQDFCNGVVVGEATFALRVREMEKRATNSTLTTSRFLALPAGYLEIRQLQITIDDELYDIQFKDIKNMCVYDTADVPTQYTITSQLEFNRKSDQAYVLEMDYWKKPDALSSSNTTNDILTNYPNIYLHGCLAHAFTWSMQYDLANYWRSQFASSIAAANRTSRKGRYGKGAKKTLVGMVV